MKSKSKKNILVTCLMLIGWACHSQLAHGHFVWIAKDQKTGEIRIYFGEGPEPDQKIFLKGIAGIKTWQLEAKEFGAAKIVQKSDGDEGWFVAQVDRECQELVGDVTYGLFSRGDAPMLLHYSAKYGSLSAGQSLSPKSNKILPLNILATATDKQLQLQVVWRNQPVADCEVVVVDAAGKSHELKTDSQGNVSLPAATGRFLIRAKTVDPKSGSYKGQDYSEKRTYCTLVLEFQSHSTLTTNEASAKATSKAVAAEPRNVDEPDKLADLPEGLTSFGGAIANGRLYVYGGHTGKAHQYYQSGQNKTLYELDLNKPGNWNRVAQGLGLQGLAMVAHNGKIYRLGGFHAHNKEGEKHDLRSVNEFAVFDFDHKKWKLLEPLPEGRSSFDAVVVKDTLYVVGGWQMKGKEGTTWAKTALKFDLGKKNAQWEKLPNPPFQRRALSVGYQGDKLVVVGGMQQKGGPTKKVALFDLTAGQWADGPELPGEGRMEGFGSACFNVGGQLIASTYGGNVYRLADDFSKWEVIGELDEGRFFHRLLPMNDKQFVLVGGASMESGKFYDLEVRSK